MEPTSVNKAYHHLNEIKENLVNIDADTWPPDLLESFIRSYDALNELDLKELEVKQLMNDFENVNEKLEELCQKHIFGKTEIEDLILEKISEFRTHIHFMEKSSSEGADELEDFISYLPNEVMDYIFEYLKADEELGQKSIKALKETSSTFVPLAREHHKMNYLERIPDEVKIKIFDFLQKSDLKELVAVAKDFSRVGQDPELLGSRGVYDKRMDMVFQKEPEPWKDKDFIKRYQSELNHVRQLTFKKIRLTPEFMQFISKNCPKLQKIALPYFIPHSASHKSDLRFLAAWRNQR